MKAESEIQALSEERYAAYRQREDRRRSWREERRLTVKERDLMAHAIDEGRYEKYRAETDGR